MACKPIDLGAVIVDFRLYSNLKTTSKTVIIIPDTLYSNFIGDRVKLRLKPEI